MSNNKKNILIIVSILLLIIAIFTGIMSIQINGKKISKNIYVNDVNLGGLSKTQAQQLLSDKYKINNIKVNYLDKSWNVDYKKIELNYDIAKTVDKAYSLNRNKSAFENLIKTIKLNFGNKDTLKIYINYKNEKLKEEINKISKEINIDVKNASLSIDGSNVKVSDESEGIEVNIQKSIESLEKELLKGKFESKLIVTKVEPKVKKEQLKDIDTVLASYSTNIVGSVLGRNDNIRLATKKTSDVLLMPGDQFSYNKYTGLRTVENGYKNAPVIVEGTLQEGLGGGVCQVSSTLYNSVLYSGLEIVNVKNHSIPSGYVPKGRDATVTDEGIDFVFKNNLKHPIYVNNYVSGSTIICQIYGSSKDIQNIQIITNTDQVSVAPIKKVDDPSMPKGKEKVLERGIEGYTVSTYRLYKDKNGKVSKKEKVSTSYYPKKQGVIAVGTKEEKVEQKPEEKQEVKQEQKPEVKSEVNQSNTNENKPENQPQEDNNHKITNLENNNPPILDGQS